MRHSVSTPWRLAVVWLCVLAAGCSWLEPPGAALPASVELLTPPTRVALDEPRQPDEVRQLIGQAAERLLVPIDGLAEDEIRFAFRNRRHQHLVVQLLADGRVMRLGLSKPGSSALVGSSDDLQGAHEYRLVIARARRALREGAALEAGAAGAPGDEPAPEGVRGAGPEPAPPEPSPTDKPAPVGPHGF